jgi:CO/xanthine dehydrogenase FAD-binding subunit
MSVTFGPVVENLALTPEVERPEQGIRLAGVVGRSSTGAERPRFEYVLVRTYDEAVHSLKAFGKGAKVIAGGQSLVPMMNLRLVKPTVLIDLNGIGAERPYVERDHLVVPAMTHYSAVLVSDLVRSKSPLVAEAVAHVGNVRVRNRGTLGGSLAQGEATAEIGAVSLALEGEILTWGPQGCRAIRCEDFFLGDLRTSLEPAEVITALRLPLTGTRRGWSFQEMARRSGGVAVVGVAANVELAGDNSVRAVRVGLIGVADRPILGQPIATSSLLGQIPSVAHVDAVAAAVAAATCPVTDVLASGSYRRRLARVLTRRALIEALLRAGARIADA